MPFIFTVPKPFGKKKHSIENLRLLNMIEKYIADTEAAPVSILTQFWSDQAAALTYQEIRRMIEDEDATEEDLETWRKDYSILVGEKLSPMWEDALIVGPIGNLILDNLKDKSFKFDPIAEGVKRWIKNRGADFITDSVQEQRRAIQRLTMASVRDNLSPEELAGVIRPCIGLTSRQAEANLRYYNNMKARLRKEHPRMKEQTIIKKARSAQLKYAERQHRYRAQTIARTELAEAYNQGADFGIRQAQEEGYIGHVLKVWVTAREFLYESKENHVCQYCEAVEGESKEMDEYFDLGKCGMKRLPPAHPRCRCVVKYVETEEGPDEKYL